MRTMLVTGSAGLVGAEAVRYFREKGWEVVGIDNNQRARMFGTKPQETENDIDIRDIDALSRLFEKHHFNAIIHTAAQPSHDWSKDNPLTDFYINTVGTLHLLEMVRVHNPECVFVNVSTDKIYGEGMEREDLVEQKTRYHSDKPFDETTPIRPLLSPFGAGKLAADYYTQEYSLQYGIRAACFRPGCITGRNHQGAEYHGFLAYLAKCVREKQTYKVFGFKGKQVRDQIHAYDLVTAFEAFIENPKLGAVYNIGGGLERSISVLEAISAFEKATGNEATVITYDEPRLGDRIYDIHDVSKFRREYPTWEYQYSLDDIIKDLCQ